MPSPAISAGTDTTPRRRIIHRHRTWLSLVVCLLLIALWIGQISDAGFYHDDAVTSSYDAEAAMGDHNAWTYSVAQLGSLVRYQGRLSVAYSLGITPFHVLFGENLFLYRLWHLLWTLLTLLSFAWYIRILCGNWRTAAFTVGVCMALFCINTFHSSLISYGVILQQMLVFGFLGAGLAHVAARRTRPLPVAIASYVCIALAILTTEFALVFIPLILVGILFTEPWKRVLRAAAPYFLITLVYVVATVLSKQPGQYEGASFGSTQPAIVAATWAKQLSGTFPLAFAFTEDGRAALGSGWYRTAVFSIAFWMFLGAGALAFQWLGRAVPPQNRRNILLLACAGIVLVIVSSGLTSLSVKYQAALSYGVAYVQVFVQYMGAALLITALYLQVKSSALRPATKSQISWAFSVVLAGFFAMTLQLNSRIVDYMNRAWQYPREMLAGALPLAGLDTSATPLFVIDRPWLQRWEWPPFAYRHIGRPAEFVTVTDFLSGQATAATGSDNAYYVTYPLRSNGEGSVFIARIEGGPEATEGGKLRFVPGSGRWIAFGPDPESAQVAASVLSAASGPAKPQLLNITRVGQKRSAAVLQTSPEALPASP